MAGRKQLHDTGPNEIWRQAAIKRFYAPPRIDDAHLKNHFRLVSM
jgi:hypothetical protein